MKQPSWSFRDLIEALHRRSGSEVSVLVDDYDAPVTSRRFEPKLAAANADVLHWVYAVMTRMDVRKIVEFKLFAGTTRYGVWMPQGGPYLEDVALRRRDFADVCGFTPAELESRFPGRLEEALEALKSSGDMPPSSGMADLVAEIARWYGGYRFGFARGRHDWDPVEVLNPHSVLHFLENRSFGGYWSRL